MNSMKRKKKRINLAKVIFSVAVISVAVYLRIDHLSADSPIDLKTGSAGYFVDEGGWVYNARNKVLFGRWKLDDDYNKMYMEPIVNFFYFLSFKLFGVGLFQARLVPVFFTLIIFLSLFVVVNREFGWRCSLLVVLILGFNYVFFIFSRLALPRMGMIAFMALSLLAFQEGLKKPYFMIFSGLFAVIAYSCQKSALYFFPVLVITSLFMIWREWGKGENSSAKTERKRLFYCLVIIFTTVMVLYVVWIFGYEKVYLAKIKSIVSTIYERTMPTSGAGLMKNIAEESSAKKYLSYMPVLWGISVIYLGYILYKIFHQKMDINWLEVFAALWFVGCIAFFSMINERARVLRYYVSAIPAMSVMAGIFITKVFGLKELKAPQKINYFFSIPLFCILFYGLRGVIIYRNLSSHPATLSLIISIIATAITIMALRFSRIIFPNPGESKGRIVPGVFVKAGIKVFVVIFFILWIGFLNFISPGFDSRLGIKSQIMQYMKWRRNRQFVVRDRSRELGKILPKNSVIAGLWSPLICLENDFKCYVSFENPDINNRKDFLEKYGITHIFAEEKQTHEETRYYRRKFPEAMRDAKLIFQCDLWRTEVKVFALGNKKESGSK